MLASTTSLKRMAAVALLAAGAMAAVPAQAAPIGGSLALGNADSAMVQQVHYRGWGWGGAVAGGLIAGAIIGGALSQPYYYSYPPDYYYGAPPVYVGPSDAVGYCMRRYRSYDPASGTYLGYDGYRHPCP